MTTANCVVVIKQSVIVVMFYRVEVGLGFLENIVILFAVKRSAVSQCKLVTLIRVKYNWKLFNLLSQKFIQIYQELIV